MFRFHLLEIPSKNENEIYNYFPQDKLNYLKNIEDININPFCVSLYVKGQCISICFYNKKIFLGIENDKNIIFSFKNIIPRNIQWSFSILINRLINFYERKEIYSLKSQEKWEKAIPLLDKVIDIEENYEKYKKEYNQYKEINIPNNGFIGNKEDLINQCVFLFECYQSIDNSKFSIDFDSMSVTKNGISYISIENGQIYNNVNETDIKNDLDKLVNEYINNLQDEVQNQLNLLHKEQGLVSIINFKGNKKIYDIKDKKDKNVFHYELEKNNINQLLDCKLKISKLRQTLEKEQNKMNETTYINEHDIER